MSLPSGYKRLEYIQSSGTQYVDTGVSAPSGFQADIDFELASLSTTSTNDAIIGAHNDSAPYSRNYFAAKAAGFEVGVGEAYLQGEVPTTNERYMVDVSTVYSDIHLVVNSVEHSLTTDISATDEHSANTLYLLWCHGGSEWFSKCACKLYACRIYASDKLVRDFIPCISDTDEVGLWDDVNAVFYGNAGTGTFTAGPVMEPPEAPVNLQHLLAVRFTWSAVDGATKYNVYRDDTLLGTTTGLFYVDDTAAENTEYTYAVSAVNSAGESPKTTITVYTKSGYFLYKPLIQSATFQ